VTLRSILGLAAVFAAAFAMPASAADSQVADYKLTNGL
jgi:hypothetical protein